jgi:hypothetical protein
MEKKAREKLFVSVLQPPNPLLDGCNPNIGTIRVLRQFPTEEPAWQSDAELMRYVDTPDIQNQAARK